MNIGMEFLHPIESENGAIMAGYTVDLIAWNVVRDIHIRVRPEDMPRIRAHMTVSAFDCDAMQMGNIDAACWHFSAPADYEARAHNAKDLRSGEA